MMIIKRNLVFVLSMCIIIAAYFLIQPVAVSGSSMNPTYYDGQLLIMKKAINKKAEYDRFQIIVFETYLETAPYCIKRIIGLPGETIQIKGGNIYINGNIIDDKQGLATYYAGLASVPITLEDDEYFVLGDNRDNSLDSRSPEIGNVLKGDIIGLVW